MSLRIGVDIGGTFTDFALLDTGTGRLFIHKQLTTPVDPARGVLDGLPILLRNVDQSIDAVHTLIHGTTLVTNAVIERRGAVTGMLCTRGFADMLDIGLERRYDMYDLTIAYPDALVPRGLRRELDERMDAQGRVRLALDPEQAVAAARDLLETHGIQSLAVCLLNSHANDAHERAAMKAIRAALPALKLSGSADVFPFMREYPRWTTATMNAFALPLFDDYVSRLETGLTDLGFTGELFIMASSGGTVPPAVARRYPVRMLESGPAAGILRAAALAGDPATDTSRHVLAFDMGGTTAKGALVHDGRPAIAHGMEVARIHEFRLGSGLPVRIPVVDMIEIGAGGGSIADIDPRGVLRVGPRSAGADPGPACYGQGGDKPTLSDANLLLGYLDGGSFLGGRMALDRDAARSAMEECLAQPLSVDLDRAAWGVHETINEDVARAFRNHASERGFDYRQATMIAFGGSGPIHACRVARKLRLPQLLLPSAAGVMSALGLLSTPLSFESLLSAPMALEDLDVAGFDRRFHSLAQEAARQLGMEAWSPANTIRRLDMRYRGQGHELEVVLPDGDGADLLPRLTDLFTDAYEKLFAKSFPNHPLDITAWKTTISGPDPLHGLAMSLIRDGEAPPPAAPRHRQAYFPDIGRIQVPVLHRQNLKVGDCFDGPALVEEAESTAVIGPGDRATLDAAGNLRVTIGGMG